MVRIFFLPYLGNRSKSDPCSYELFCLESHILSFPKVLQIPPESPCMMRKIRISTELARSWLLLHAWFTTIQFENSVQLTEKHKDINRSGKTFGKKWKDKHGHRHNALKDLKPWCQNPNFQCWVDRSPVMNNKQLGQYNKACKCRTSSHTTTVTKSLTAPLMTPNWQWLPKMSL